ncbi:MAG: DUF6452 family protein [Bacteroidota bacterium]
MVRNLGFTAILYLYALIMSKKVSWFIFFSLLAVSCLDEPDCFSLNNNVLGIAFKKLSDNKADTLFFESVKADGYDSVFYPTTVATGFYLPVNYYTNETSFTLRGFEKEYHLSFAYSAKAQFVSEECGERFVLGDLQLLEHDFDSARIVNTTPGKGKSTHLEVYRCPRLNMIKIAFRKVVDQEEEVDTVEVQNISLNYPSQIFITSDTLSKLTIPLNTAASSSEITFNFKNGTSGKVVLAYDREQKVLFNICGETTVLSELRVISSTPGMTVRVINDNFQDPPSTNIEIIQ